MLLDCPKEGFVFCCSLFIDSKTLFIAFTLGLAEGFFGYVFPNLNRSA